MAPGPFSHIIIIGITVLRVSHGLGFVAFSEPRRAVSQGLPAFPHRAERCSQAFLTAAVWNQGSALNGPAGRGPAP